MAVFTDISEKDCRQIAESYQLGAVTSVIGIADGDTETTFLFRSQRGEFIVTLFESGAEPFDLERAFRTMEILAAAGVPCPVTCRTAAGAATIVVSGKLVAVVGFVPGSLAGVVSPERCHNLAAVVATIHCTLLTSKRNANAMLPRGSVHGALTRENVFFTNDAVSGIINFRLRHDDILVSELARLIVEWALDPFGLLNSTLAGSLIQGYETVRPLTIGERQALPSLIMAEATLRFTDSNHTLDMEEKAYAMFRVAKGLVASAYPS